MQFVNVLIENFRSHETTNYPFKDKGLTLIEGVNDDEGGSNGAGKSSIWDAVAWCLFGETMSGVKGDEVINRAAKKNCAVVVQAIVDGKELVVSRYRKCKTNKNKLYYTYDGKKIEKGTTPLTQKFLLDQIGIDLDLFRTTVLFAQGEMFNFVDETDKKQKEILGKIVKISFEETQKKAKLKLREIEDSSSEIENKISKLKYRQEASKLPELEDASKNFENNKKAEIKKLVEVVKETKAEYDEISVLDEDGMKKIRTDLKEKVEALGDKERDLQQKRDRINIKYDDLEKKVRVVKLQGPSCDKCGQEIDAKKTKETLMDYVTQMKKLKILRDKIPLATELVAERSDLKKKILKLDDKIEENSSRKFKKERLESQISDKKDQIKVWKDQENSYDAEIKKEKKTLKSIEDGIKTFEQEMGEVQEDLAYWTFWVNGFGDKGIKSFIFDTICGQLTTKANHYLGLLSNGSMSVQFDTQTRLKSGEIREKFEVVVTKDSNSVKYSEFSGGEKRRISLSVDMALAELMKDFYDSDFNIVVFDEQTSFMDKEGRECYLTLLKEQAREKSVFVVDHDAEFKALFDDVITITKKDGVSRIAV